MKWRRLVLFPVGDYQRRFIVSSKMNRMTRRKATKLIGASSGALLLPISASHLFSETESLSMLTRTIPSSGEKLSVIGLGTWNVFDMNLNPDNEKQLGDVLSLFVKLSGSVIDSSPMYGRAEEVVGTLASKLGLRDKLFIATKVLTLGKEVGIDSMVRSISRLGTKWVDRLQDTT